MSELWWQALAARLAGRMDRQLLQWALLALCSLAAIGLVI